MVPEASLSSSELIYDHDETWKCDGMQVAGCQLALPCPAEQWHQCDSECIFVTIEIHLTTLFSEIFCFVDFFGGGTGQDGTGRTNKQTNGQTDIGTDRLFSENIILDRVVCSRFLEFLCLNCLPTS